MAGKGYKYCVHMYVNVKMIPVKITSLMGEGIRKRGGGGDFKYAIFDTL
jgi:hypothetical protein